MSPDIFVIFLILGCFLTVIGVIIFAKRVADDGLWGLDRFDYSVITTLALAWLWLPWLVYGLTLLPWSQVRKVLPPVAQTAPNPRDQRAGASPAPTESRC